jgi:hypothetical protein
VDFRYTDEQLELRERAAALAREIMAYEDEREEHRGAMIADSACDIALCRTLTHQVAWEADNGMPRKLLHAKARKRGLDGLLRYGAALPVRESVSA